MENAGWEPNTVLEKILDLARWAPSGDNLQTWRFEIADDNHLVVHAYDTRDWCVYDLDGRASQIALGALLETISIAASEFQLSVAAHRRSGSPDEKPVFDVFFGKDENSRRSELLPFIKKRCTQRRMMKATSLSLQDKRALEEALGPDHTVQWVEGTQGRWSAARLMFKNAKIRLTMPEAYPVHSVILEKNARFSVDKIPDKAVGLDPVAMYLMHWALKSWKRVDFLNRYMAGTVLPRIELDLLPSLFCAAHFVIISSTAERGFEAQVESGRAVQRFWLTAAQRGLQFQPEMTPLIFATYIREGIRFTAETRLTEEARSLARNLESLIGTDNAARGVFMGRLGYGQGPYARSLRLSVPDLSIPKTS